MRAFKKDNIGNSWINLSILPDSLGKYQPECKLFLLKPCLEGWEGGCT